jgi:hypothetical protein
MAAGPLGPRATPVALSQAIRGLGRSFENERFRAQSCQRSLVCRCDVGAMDDGRNRPRLVLGDPPRVLGFCPPETGVLVAKQKHDSGRKKMDQRRSKEKREPGGRQGVRAALGKGGGRGKR